MRSDNSELRRMFEDLMRNKGNDISKLKIHQIMLGFHPQWLKLVVPTWVQCFLLVSMSKGGRHFHKLDYHQCPCSMKWEFHHYNNIEMPS